MISIKFAMRFHKNLISRKKPKSCRRFAATTQASAARTTSATSQLRLPPLPPSDASLNRLKETHYFSEDAHWLIPGLILQGQHPARGRESISKRVDDIVHHGCTSFVCFQAESSPQSKEAILLGGIEDWRDEDSNYFIPYRPEVEAAMEKLETLPEFLHFGIRDMSPVHDLKELASLVETLVSRVNKGSILYMHCWGGKGRAGLVSACLLGHLYQHVDAEEALTRINTYAQLRCMENGSFIESPETDEQRDQVREYYKFFRGEPKP